MTERKACLAWYALPETREAQDTLWQGIAGRLKAAGMDGVPDRLTRGVPVARMLSDPDLLFAQCCGYDVIYGFAECLQLVGTPCYSAPDCHGPRYASHVLVRADDAAHQLADLRGRICAINGFNSHSGANALRGLVAPLSGAGRFFSGVRVSGGHLASLKMLTSGLVDAICIDAVLHELLHGNRHEAVQDTRVLATTAQVPAPPFVTAKANAAMVGQLAEALEDTLCDPAFAASGRRMLLERIERLPLAAYSEILDVEGAALALGYTELHATSQAILD